MSPTAEGEPVAAPAVGASPTSSPQPSLVDSAIYVGGRRTDTPQDLQQTFQLLREGHGMAWIGLYRPTPAEVEAVAEEFGMHPLAVEDAIAAHQRPKLEHYGNLIFAVLRPARYLDETEKVEFGELHVFVGPDVVVTIRHAESPDLARVRARLEASPELLCLGPEAVLYAILDQVVDEYAPVVAGLENDIDEIEDQLFSGDPSVTRRIYELTREVAAFQRATRPLTDMVAALKSGEENEVDVELRRLLRDVADHVIRIVERADGFRALLQNALTVHSTLVGQQQNDEMRSLTQTSLDQSEQVKRISSWAAILFTPTLVGTIYGMNFHNMPELAWRYGYPLALAAMVVMGLVLYLVFRRSRWI